MQVQRLKNDEPSPNAEKQPEKRDEHPTEASGNADIDGDANDRKPESVSNESVAAISDDDLPEKESPSPQATSTAVVGVQKGFGCCRI